MLHNLQPTTYREKVIRKHTFYQTFHELNPWVHHQLAKNLQLINPMTLDGWEVSFKYKDKKKTFTLLPCNECISYGDALR